LKESGKNKKKKSLIVIVSNFVIELWLAAVGLAITKFAWLAR